MGVPKFFRYISERYPCLSEYVKEYQIPVFDNLYLDMNGIIHMCSHPDDNDPHFRITEEKLFSDIFHYLDFLFRLIKPQKLFFMAVDGVAPRAKMNQQRGRRFRSAKDAEKREAQALKKGEVLPDAARFDSNCITPGTEFMAKLQEQLKYFVVKKISTDKMWKDCKVILSGQETPGEGEHKIMDYIRYLRSQPGYDPNTRHCLYGLDADLIMLGLCTHEPHFSLLREEVKFGRKSTRRNNVPEDIHFYLLHLSLMREYLELEFAALKYKLAEAGQFAFDLENIIDDWILMGFLVGNDFIPHLPDMHIAQGALPLLYAAYKEVLPTLDGYINEGGTLNLKRFETFLKRLGEMDFKNFEEKREDLLYMEAKTGRKFLPEGPTKCTDPALAELISRTDLLDVDSEPEDEDDVDLDDDEAAFKNFKDEYYRNKLDYGKVTKDVLREQAEGYVRAIQWNLNYYYNGVSSWSWYYPHHYSPYISDVQGFSDLKIDFDLGEPFKPYEQLLAVLPAASKQLLPEVYHHLMTDPNSSISDYYPEEFQTDLNGKRQDWEAVVLVPFIDELKLLEAMEPCNKKLSNKEKDRNKHGPMLEYTFSVDELGVYKAPEYFSSIVNHAKCIERSIEEIRVPREKLIKGAYPGAKFDVYYPGFPTMKHLDYEGELVKERVKVFEQPTRNESLMLKVKPKELYFDDYLTDDLLGKIVWVGWPHMQQAKIVALSNRKQRISLPANGQDHPLVEEKDIAPRFEREVEGIVEFHKERMCIDFGEIKITVHVKIVSGKQYVFTKDGEVNLEKQFTKIVSFYPFQGIVVDLKAHEEQEKIYKDLNDFFPICCVCFSVVHPVYGSQGTIVESVSEKNELKTEFCVYEEPDFGAIQEADKKLRAMYTSAHICAGYLQISNFLLSRLVGSLFITVQIDAETKKSVNVGLNLRHNKRNLETPGYTKKIENSWYYSDKTKELVRTYHEKFPEIFTYVPRKNSGEELIADEVYEEDPAEHIANIQSWLKSLPIHNLERRICGSSVLELELVKEIEIIIDAKYERKFEQMKLDMKPTDLYRPGIQTGRLVPDEKTQTQVFDRIVNVEANSLVPLAAKGTVVAVHKSENSKDNPEDLYDIVFDEVFPGGISVLNCTEGRGYRMYKKSFLNLTHGKREYEKIVGVPGALLAKAREFAKDRAFIDSFKVQTPAYQSSAFASFNPAPNPKIRNHRNNDFDGLNRNMNFNQNPPRNTRPTTSQNWRQPSSSNAQQQSSMKQPKYVPPKEKKQNTNFEDFINFGKMKQNGNEKPQQQQQVKKLEVDTELLKRMLNISGTNQQQQNAATTPTQVSPLEYANTISIQRRPVNATVDLLNYFQSNYLGCPRYTYFKNGNFFTAQVTLPNGQAIIGKEAQSKEEASELVASEALGIIHKSSANLNMAPSLPPAFPVPPRQWVQPHNQEVSPRNNKPSPNKQTTPPFVPLQAIKKRNSGGARREDKHTKPLKEGQNVPQTPPNEKERKQQSSMSKRRPRIAARFGQNN